MPERTKGVEILDEAEAIRRCQSGDKSGIEVLYQSYHLQVFKFALANVRHYDLAEDITQQVFMELFAAIKKYKLQDAKNRRMINADAKLRTVFGGKKQVSMFEMTKLVSKHMS